MHVAVDVDDTILHFWPRVVECYNDEFGECVTVAEQTRWERNPIKDSPHFGEGRLYPSWWAWWRDRHWLWASCDAIDGAIGGLAYLSHMGHYVELLTHKPSWARREMTAWLAKWHPVFDRLTFVDPGSPKDQASSADVLIDDKPRNVSEWTDVGRHAVVFHQPWNAHMVTSFSPGPSGGHALRHRAYGWTDGLGHSVLDAVGYIEWKRLEEEGIRDVV